jgi:hypothetical protein
MALPNGALNFNGQINIFPVIFLVSFEGIK